MPRSAPPTNNVAELRAATDAIHRAKAAGEFCHYNSEIAQFNFLLFHPQF